jgi:hypothetical protein
MVFYFLFYCILLNAVFIVINSIEAAGLIVKPLLPYFCVTSFGSRITTNVAQDVLWLLLPILDYKSMVRESDVKRYVQVLLSNAWLENTCQNMKLFFMFKIVMCRIYCVLYLSALL